MIFCILVLIWLVIYTIVLLPFLIFMPMKLRIYCSVVGVRIVLFILKISDGISYEVRGRANIPDTPCIVAAAHQSPLETLILMTVFKKPVYIMKKELRFFPFLGLHFMLLQMIFVDRNNRVKALKSMVKLSKCRIKQTRDIIIFPQGTRVEVGTKAPYKQGVAILYDQLTVPVVPVSLNTGLFWSRDFFSKKNPGKAIIEILPAIPPGISKKELLEKIELQIESKNKELLFQ